MKRTIKNAIATCKAEGYDQVVYIDDGIYSFSRDYPSNNMYRKEDVIGRVVGDWINGIYTVKYVPR